MNEQALDGQVALQILDRQPFGIAARKAGGDGPWINRALAAWLGLEAGSRVGEEIAAILFGEQDILELRDGDRLRYLRREEPLVTETDVQGWEVYCFRDCTAEAELMAANQRLQGQLERLDLTDAETGVLSHRALMLVLEPQVSRSRRYSNPLSVVVLELEGAGADALRRAARALKGHLRWADVVGRDEQGRFVLVLPETPAEAAEAIAAKIDHALAVDGAACHYRLGVAQWRLGDDAADLLHRAAAELASGQAAAGAGG